MARSPKPWLRKATGNWYVWYRGKQVNLGPDKAKAISTWHRISLRRPTGACTIEQLVKRYWRWLKNERSPETVSRRKPILRSFLTSLTAGERKRPATELTPSMVQDWADAWPNPTTRGDRIGLIKTIYNWAIDFGLLEVSPIARLKRPSAVIRQEFIRPDLWPQVLSLSTDEPFRDWLTVTLSSGARVTEMFKFTAPHFDGAKFTLPIVDSKGRRKSRVVHVPEDSLPIVQRLVQENPAGALFRNRRGKPWNRNSIRCRFRRLKRLLQMPSLTATMLRHSYAHWRLTLGQDSLTVSKLLGHVDTTMLARRYGHVEQNPEFMRGAANFAPLPIRAVVPQADAPV
jgi:integrase